MVTLVVGQVIQQRANGRIWKIVAEMPRRLSSNVRRWRIEMITPAPGDDRMIGEYTDCSETWLIDHCVDFPSSIAPPCGDGVQVVRICLANRRVVEERLFQRAADAVSYCAQQLEETAHTHAEWFGWQVEADNDTPDLIATLEATLEGNELVWAEP